MRCIDPGHRYLLQVYDVHPDVGPGAVEDLLVFMKRQGEKYPGNTTSHPGTNCQEVLRALIDRVKYLDDQDPCDENTIIFTALRTALIAFEVRAARRHGLDPARRWLAPHRDIETYIPCPRCGHVFPHRHEAGDGVETQATAP